MTEGQQAKQSSQPGGPGVEVNVTGRLGAAGVQAVPAVVRESGMPTRSELLLSPVLGETLTKLLEA